VIIRSFVSRSALGTTRLAVGEQARRHVSAECSVHYAVKLPLGAHHHEWKSATPPKSIDVGTAKENGTSCARSCGRRPAGEAPRSKPKLSERIARPRHNAVQVLPRRGGGSCVRATGDAGSSRVAGVIPAGMFDGDTKRGGAFRLREMQTCTDCSQHRRVHRRRFRLASVVPDATCGRGLEHRASSWRGIGRSVCFSRRER